jgi:UDP-N-acetylmuramoyl-L-alanyl-D-glutamate--2,6-diaminopimelate ligase
MDIKLILKNIVKTDLTLSVSGLSLNTKTLKKGDVFVALQGEKTHGIEFIENAIEKGCVAVLIDGKDFNCNVPTIRIDNLRTYLSMLAQNFYTQSKKCRSYCSHWNKWQDFCESLHISASRFLGDR